MMYKICVDHESIGTVDLPEKMTQEERKQARRKIAIKYKIPMTYIRLYPFKDLDNPLD